MIDLQDPALEEGLRRRSANGRYEISEIELVKDIRARQAQGDTAGVRTLCEVLLGRCLPVFQQHTRGLRQRPLLREEAIANLNERLLREVLNPRETFLVQNFIHYLRCLCTDEFTRILRQEGLRYRRDDEGRPAGRPMHIPQALLEPLQPDDEDAPYADIADPEDQFSRFHATNESQRILTYLSDPMDRLIMVLRAIEHMKWDDIALICRRTERTVRHRYVRACRFLRSCVLQESAEAAALWGCGGSRPDREGEEAQHGYL